MAGEPLRMNRSLLIALAAVGLGAIGYLAWSFVRPDPYVLSERIVRDTRREVSYEVREFQRELRAAREAGRGVGDVIAAIDRRTAEAVKAIDGVVDEAREQLTGLNIAVRTQRNRIGRIDSRAQEAKEMIQELAEEARAKARGDQRGGS